MAKSKDPWAHLTDEQRAFINERALAQLDADCMADIDHRHDTLSQFISEGGTGRALECISDDKIQLIVRLGFDPSTGGPATQFVPEALSPVEIATLTYLTELALMEFPYKAAKPSKKKKKGPPSTATWETKLIELVDADPKIRHYEQIPGEVIDTIVNMVADHIEARTKYQKKMNKQKEKEAKKAATPPP